MAACSEMLGWDVPKTLAKTDAIYDTILKIFAMAEQRKDSNLSGG